MSKGSKRRPRQCSREQYEQNWLSTFTKREREQGKRDWMTRELIEESVFDLDHDKKGGNDHGR